MKTESEVLERAVSALRGIGAVRREAPGAGPSQPVERPATCCPDCYEIEPGKWTHRPWNGCRTTEAATVEQRRVEVTCLYCQGSGRCGCITCWRGGIGQEGECVACHGTGKARMWIH